MIAHYTRGIIQARLNTFANKAWILSKNLLNGITGCQKL